jgi:hypothetical protein
MLVSEGLMSVRFSFTYNNSASSLDPLIDVHISKAQSTETVKLKPSFISYQGRLIGASQMTEVSL